MANCNGREKLDGVRKGLQYAEFEITDHSIKHCSEHFKISTYYNVSDQ